MGAGVSDTILTLDGFENAVASYRYDPHPECWEWRDKLIAHDAALRRQVEGLMRELDELRTKARTLIPPSPWRAPVGRGDACDHDAHAWEVRPGTECAVCMGCGALIAPANRDQEIATLTRERDALRVDLADAQGELTQIHALAQHIGDPQEYETAAAVALAIFAERDALRARLAAMAEREATEDEVKEADDKEEWYGIKHVLCWWRDRLLAETAQAPVDEASKAESPAASEPAPTPPVSVTLRCGRCHEPVTLADVPYCARCEPAPTPPAVEAMLAHAAGFSESEEKVQGVPTPPAAEASEEVKTLAAELIRMGLAPYALAEVILRREAALRESVQRWTDDAARYCENADYWRERAERAEAEMEWLRNERKNVESWGHKGWEQSRQRFHEMARLRDPKREKLIADLVSVFDAPEISTIEVYTKALALEQHERVRRAKEKS